MGGLNGLFISRVCHKSSSKGKFSEFMTNHIFSNEYWDMLFSIMNTKSVPNKFWSNSTRSRPGFNNRFFTRFVEFLDFFHYTRINIRSFFETTSHKKKLKIVENISPEVFQNEFAKSNDLLICVDEFSRHVPSAPMESLGLYADRQIDDLHHHHAGDPLGS